MGQIRQAGGARSALRLTGTRREKKEPAGSFFVSGETVIAGGRLLSHRPLLARDHTQPGPSQRPLGTQQHATLEALPGNVDYLVA